jgi:drug/metabolite transporter (DMT)-like permease
MLRTFLLTASALVAFAANSVFCRLALGTPTIDAASFTSIRVASGAAMLLLITTAVSRRRSGARGNWTSATLLFLYAIAFSFAYLSLSIGAGALILFGAVQVTMILSALRAGERPWRLEWIGLAIALAGLVYLVLPGVTAPSPAGSVLMVVAGVSWGFYSLRGRGTADPLAATTDNFVRAVPLVAVVSLATLRRAEVSGEGVALAVLSGAVASGVGYVIWYAALKGLTATRAATVQLAVPVLAALGGVVFLSEGISIRLVLAALMILGGVGLAVSVRGKTLQAAHPPAAPAASEEIGYPPSFRR